MEKNVELKKLIAEQAAELGTFSFSE